MDEFLDKKKMDEFSSEKTKYLYILNDIRIIHLIPMFVLRVKMIRGCSSNHSDM
jgi:hypothetical protein